MDAVVEFLRAHGWCVRSVSNNLVCIAIEPNEIVRACGRLRRSLEDAGCALYEAKPPYERPCAWAEYDVTTRRACVWLVTSDEWLAKPLRR